MNEIKSPPANPDNTGPSKLASAGHRGLQFFLWIGFVALFSLVAVVLFTHRSTQVMPEFYQAALDIAPESYQEAGREFESQLLQLNTDVRHLDHWRARFTQDQVNGWLAFELPQNFPETIPPQVSDPRIDFSEDQIQLAFRLASPHFNGIVTAKGTVFCTGENNQIAIQIQSLQSGVVPLPVSQWADPIAKGCARAGINLRWSQKDGMTLANVDLPQKFLDIEKRNISLQSIEVVESEIILTGTATPDEQLDKTQESSSVVKTAGPNVSSESSTDQR